VAENQRVKDAMNTLLKLFESDNIEKAARAVFRGCDIPSDRWSFANRILMYLSGTEDARGFRQWKEAGRYVKKGARAFYIFGPVMKEIAEEKISENGELVKEEKTILAGFRAVPVFRFEDTDGAPLVKEEFRIDIPCEFSAIIQELGLKVMPVRFNGSGYGSYSLNNKKIELASPDMDVFLHELAHAVDDKLHGLKAGQHSGQEVIAEFSAAVIGHLMGYKIPLGGVKEYIGHYSFRELVASLGRVEKVVSCVIERTRAISAEPALVVRA
jgi:hypothetical protein